MGRKNTALPRGLSRVDHTASGVHLWRVQYPDGSFTYFGDSKYGSKAAALRAALIHLEALPIIGVRASRSKTNTTGVIGVSPVRHKGELVAFKAISGSRKGQQFKLFSVRDYGENVAFRLACVARSEFIGKMEDTELTKRNLHIKRLLARLEESSR